MSTLILSSPWLAEDFASCLESRWTQLGEDCRGPDPQMPSGKTEFTKSMFGKSCTLCITFLGLSSTISMWMALEVLCIAVYLVLFDPVFSKCIWPQRQPPPPSPPNFLELKISYYPVQFLFLKIVPENSLESSGQRGLGTDQNKVNQSPYLFLRVCPAPLRQPVFGI